MRRKRSRRSLNAGEGQLALGLEPACRGRVVNDRPGARVAIAANLLAELGYEVAAIEPGRWSLTLEAALRDWTLVLTEREGAVTARAYVMRAPAEEHTRAGVLETILAANAGSANARFALDSASVVVEATLATAGAMLGHDALRAAIVDLTRTCNDAYPRLLSLATETADLLGTESLILRVA